MRHRATILASILAAIVIVGLGVWAFASRGEGDGEDDPGASNPESAAVDYEAALAHAPPALAELYESDALLEGGPEAFKAQLAELDGHPVVVNKWASWCGPCRFEFPFFQAQAAKRGDEVAFLGVDAKDAEEAARTFLEELPLPYPSFSDPDDEIGKLFGGFYFPSTAFYHSSGRLVHLKPGPYESEAELAADIDRYAR